VYALAFAADGTLASAGDDGTVRLWNRRWGSWRPRARRILSRLTSTSARLHAQGPVSAVAFSPDCDRLAAVSGDSIALWDIASRTPLSLARTGIDISALAWSPNTIALAMGTAVAVFDVSSPGVR
jgi:WD40 repeat protein